MDSQKQKFTLDDFMTMMRAQSKPELKAAAHKLFDSLAHNGEKELPAERFYELVESLNDKIVERFGFDPADDSNHQQVTRNARQSIKQLARGQEMITWEGVYRYLFKRNKIMVRGFTLMDVKITQKSKDPEVIYASLNKIFSHLDTDKKGSLDVHKFKNFFRIVTHQMTMNNFDVDLDVMTEAMSCEQDEDDPEFEAELLVQAQEMVAMLDQDKDGEVTIDDWFVKCL